VHKHIEDQAYHKPSWKPIRVGIDSDTTGTLLLSCSFDNAQWYMYAAEDAMQLIIQGAANRRVGETKMNEQSSRSHSVFTMKVECRSSTDSGLVHTQYGTLHMVDLAGSERVKISGADGSALTEASEINKSLSVLSRVISKVSCDQLLPVSNWF
jgi:hypothetical protein